MEWVLRKEGTILRDIEKVSNNWLVYTVYIYNFELFAVSWFSILFHRHDQMKSSNPIPWANNLSWILLMLSTVEFLQGNSEIQKIWKYRNTLISFKVGISGISGIPLILLFAIGQRAAARPYVKRCRWRSGRKAKLEARLQNRISKYIFLRSHSQRTSGIFFKGTG